MHPPRPHLNIKTCLWRESASCPRSSKHRWSMHTQRSTKLHLGTLLRWQVIHTPRGTLLGTPVMASQALMGGEELTKSLYPKTGFLRWTPSLSLSRARRTTKQGFHHGAQKHHRSWKPSHDSTVQSPSLKTRNYPSAWRVLFSLFWTSCGVALAAVTTFRLPPPLTVWAPWLCSVVLLCG